MWKFHDFAINQILREINIGGSRNAKSAVKTFRGSEFVELVIFNLQKVTMFQKSKFIASKCVKMADFAPSGPPILISRKI